MPRDLFQESGIDPKESAPRDLFSEAGVKPDSPYSAQNIAGAAIEPNLSMLTGMVAAPVSGLAGLVGAALPGREGQGADWVRSVNNALTYQPVTQGGKTAQEAISYPFRKFAEGADWAGGKATDLTGSPAIGTAVNTGINALPLLASKLIPATPAADTAQGAIARRLMQSATKPTVADLQSGNAGRAIQTMLDEGINPTKGGMVKLNNIASGLDAQVKDAIANSNATVNVPTVGSTLRGPWQSAVNQVNPTADMAAIRSAWDEFKTSPQIAGKMDIPVQTAQAIKQGTYRALGNKSYGEVGSASTEAQKALARGLREQIAANVPQVVAPLGREASLMNVRDVAERRALIEANKNPAGLSLLTDNPLAALGFMADRSGAAKALLARMIYGTASPGALQSAMGSGAINQGALANAIQNQ